MCIISKGTNYMSVQFCLFIFKKLKFLGGTVHVREIKQYRFCLKKGC